LQLLRKEQVAFASAVRASESPDRLEISGERSGRAAFVFRIAFPADRAQSVRRRKKIIDVPELLLSALFHVPFDSLFEGIHARADVRVEAFREFNVSESPYPDFCIFSQSYYENVSAFHYNTAFSFKAH
jgi:hypothetical protein